MKYENFKDAIQLVSQIEKHQEELNNISDDSVQVTVNYQRCGMRTAFTIGIDSMCEHQYTKEAYSLVVDIRDDLKKRIEKLKKELEKL